jgi:hypothetical protein
MDWDGDIKKGIMKSEIDTITVRTTNSHVLAICKTLSWRLKKSELLGQLAVTQLVTSNAIRKG